MRHHNPWAWLALCAAPLGHLPSTFVRRNGHLSMRRWAPAEPRWEGSGYGIPRASRWQKKGEVEAVEPFAAAGASENVWYFGFGANINPWKLRTKRRITPIDQVAGRLPGWRLTFNHKGAMGNIEQLSSSSLTNDGPDEVHGMLLYLTPQDFKKLSQIEYEYGTTDVQVAAYDGRQIAAKAFVTPPEFKLSQSLPPTERYLNLIKDGCESMGIDSGYQAWLKSVEPQRGQRGAEYWAVSHPSAASHAAPKRAMTPKQDSGQADKEAASRKVGGPLCLAALMDFAIPGDAGLVDIGANLGKCSEQDLAAQLVRAAAAGVTHVILTGCSVAGSADARRISEQWTGGAAWEKILKRLGAAARQEIEALELANLPQLGFTAGVHPHDAKSCDGKTMAVLRKLAASPGCCSIGECGLDYDRMFSPREVQLQWCRKQVELAVELGMPLFLHERDRDPSKGKKLGSAADLQNILQDSKVDPKKVCVHCFTGGKEDLQHYVAQGYFIGLTGFAAMKRRGAHIRQMLEGGDIPVQQLMLETDCPFMMPDKEYLPDALGIAGRKNEPCSMPAVCRAVAECLKIPPEQVAKFTTSNALQFFGLQ